MNTKEHTDLGDALRFADWQDTLKDNPYISFDAKGVMQLHLQGLDNVGFPNPINLTVSAGEVIAMSGDYFGGKEVDLELPSYYEFDSLKESDNTAKECENLGEYLIKCPITSKEEAKFISSYQRLANNSTTRAQINTIYDILSTKYIPFSKTLNSYAQELAFAIKVKNYGEMLNRNMSHFTPWSVRAYTIGHRQALRYARTYYEIIRFMQDKESFQSSNSDFITIRDRLDNMPHHALLDLAYRYQALSLSMEFFSFHYYSDHYAAGHGSLVGDLRVLLPKKYGYLGGILVNNLHDELNSVTVYTHHPYDPNNNDIALPLETSGDGSFDSPKNYFNKQACLAGMNDSLSDIQRVFRGINIPKQTLYGGLAKMPDIDRNYRQPQPLFVLGKDNKIYYRTNLRQINILAPSELKATYQEPSKHGYTELTSRWSAFLLVIKLRVLSFWYQGTLQTLSPAQLQAIEDEEKALNPQRHPIPSLPRTLPGPAPLEPLPQWQRAAGTKVVMEGLLTNGLLKSSPEEEHKNPVVYKPGILA